MRLRLAQYLKDEKHIAASDTGGIVERWRWGRRVVTDPKATTPAGHLRHGVLDTLIKAAADRGFSLTDREIRYRIQCARAYETEAEIGTASSDFGDWTSLRAAGFPPVAVIEEAEPYDPRDADEKWRDWHDEQERQGNPDQGILDYPGYFPQDTYGPRTRIRELYAFCDEQERYTSNMAKRDAERRAYVDELRVAVSGDLDAAWEDAERARRELQQPE